MNLKNHNMYSKRIFLVVGLMINSLSCYGFFLEDTITTPETPAMRVVTLEGTSAGRELNVNAGILNGNGILDSNKITIDCDEFRFTGTIRCDGVCEIRAKKDFRRGMFKKEGKGVFTYIINSQEVAENSISQFFGTPFYIGVGLILTAATIGIAVYFLNSKENKKMRKKTSHSRVG